MRFAQLTPALSRAAITPNARQRGTAVGRRLERVVRRDYVHSPASTSDLSCVLVASELKSNLVYGFHDSGGCLPADLSLIDSINELHASDDVSELAKAT